MTHQYTADLFAPVAHTRHSDPETSHAAAARVNATVSEGMAAVRAALAMIGPIDDERLQLWYDAHRVEYEWPAQRCVRKRRKDLVDAGLAEYSGRKVPNPVGQLVREWRVVR